MWIHPALRRRLAVEASVRLGAVLWAGLAVVAVTRHLHASPTLQVGGLAVVVLVACAGQRPAVGVLAAGLGWLVVTGFVVHRYGELGWSGPTDLVRLAILGLAATVGCALVAPGSRTGRWAVHPAGVLHGAQR